MKYLIIFLISLTSFAEVVSEDIEKMVNQMVEKNIIDAQEAKKIKTRIQTISSDQWKQINKKTNEMAGRMPASKTPSQNRIEEVKTIDLDGKQFQEIQNQLRMIVPQYQD